MCSQIPILDLKGETSSAQGALGVTRFSDRSRVPLKRKMDATSFEISAASSSFGGGEINFLASADSTRSQVSTREPSLPMLARIAIPFASAFVGANRQGRDAGRMLQQARNWPSSISGKPQEIIGAVVVFYRTSKEGARRDPCESPQ